MRRSWRTAVDAAKRGLRLERLVARRRAHAGLQAGVAGRALSRICPARPEAVVRLTERAAEALLVLLRSHATDHPGHAGEGGQDV